MKLYPFPEPQPHLRRRATSKGRDELYWDHPTRIIRWLGRNSLRRIHEVRKLTGTYPRVDELADWLVDHCAKARRFVDDFDKMAFDAAVFALDAFDPKEHAKRVKWASNGGKKGAPRSKSFTTEQLRAVAHLSIRDQAKALGCSEATISRRRADLKAEIAAEHEAELDALFGPQEAAQALSEADEDDLLAALEAPVWISESTDPAPEADEPRTTSMSADMEIPDTVPLWLSDPLEYRRQEEAKAAAAIDPVEFLRGIEL